MSKMIEPTKDRQRKQLAAVLAAHARQTAHYRDTGLAATVRRFLRWLLT